MRVLAFIIISLALLVGCTGRQAVVEKVVDGDTVELGDGTRVRLAGINTPEKGEPCYWQARAALEALAGGKLVMLRALGTDKYGRTLAEVYVDGKNANVKMLELGLANRYYGEGIDWAEYSRAESVGRAGGGCVWKRDVLYACVKVRRDTGGFIAENVCNVTIDTNVLIKDTSASHRFERRLYMLPYGKVAISEGCREGNNTIALCQNIFNEGGDEIFIISKESGGLVGWAAYGTYAE
ncbi:MAG: thermonuclease family protein [Candidatus Micrarchaeota archaeon]|nr:thermonuclease family protein [Candidatus Micrarchaeota archaeon]